MTGPKLSRVDYHVTLTDIVKQLFPAAAAAGLTPPKISIDGDRVSRRDAQAIKDFVRQIPGVLEAYGDKNHPAHAQLKLGAAVIDHALLEYPQTAAGEPANWQERPVPARVEDMTSDELRALMRHADADPAFNAMQDPAHPQHEIWKRTTDQVTKLAYPEGAPADGDAKGAATSDASPEAAAAKAQIQALYRDPEFLRVSQDKMDPGHKAALDKMSALFKVAYPEPVITPNSPARPAARDLRDGDGAPKPVVAPAGTRRSAAELNAHPALRDRAHPEHGAVVRELSDALLSVGPAAAPAAPGSGAANG
jgi:hypothetical protein